jgi:hypothetical protein
MVEEKWKTIMINDVTRTFLCATGMRLTLLVAAQRTVQLASPVHVETGM